MSEPKMFASLTPTLLARKGTARPAMRPQLQPIQQFQEATARQIEDDPIWSDLGFNDHGEDADEDGDNVTAIRQGEVIELKPSNAEAPEVLRQQDRIAEHAKSNARREKPRRSALAHGRSAAFTLRLDADRHLALRLACTLEGRSAQQLVTEAVDQMIAKLPDVAELAARAAKRRQQL